MDRSEMILHSIDCEQKLFDQLSEQARAASDILRQDPKTDAVLTTIASLDIIRQIKAELESTDPDEIADGEKLFTEILNGEKI